MYLKLKNKAMKLLHTSFDTVRELVRTLDKLSVFIRFYFDHYAVGKYAQRWGLAEVGEQSWISTNVHFDVFKPPEVKNKSETLLKIGSHCMIGEYVHFITHDSAYIFYRRKKKLEEKRKYAPIVIEDDVFIGAGSTILPGVTIGRGSLIGAASVVTKDVEPNCVYAGNPAKKIMSIDEYVNK